jgi:hypothetical protein
MKGLTARGGESRKIFPEPPPLDRPDFHGHPTGRNSAANSPKSECAAVRPVAQPRSVSPCASFRALGRLSPRSSAAFKIFRATSRRFRVRSFRPSRREIQTEPLNPLVETGKSRRAARQSRPCIRARAAGVRKSQSYALPPSQAVHLIYFESFTSRLTRRPIWSPCGPGHNLPSEEREPMPPQSRSRLKGQ